MPREGLVLAVVGREHERPGTVAGDRRVLGHGVQAVTVEDHRDRRGLEQRGHLVERRDLAAEARSDDERAKSTQVAEHLTRPNRSG